MDNAEALRALEDLQGTLGYLPDGPYDRANDAVEKLRAHLAGPGYVRVLVEALELFVSNPIPTSEDFDRANAALAAHRKGGDV